MAAVQHDGEALRHAAEELEKDKQVVATDLRETAHTAQPRTTHLRLPTSTSSHAPPSTAFHPPSISCSLSYSPAFTLMATTLPPATQQLPTCYLPRKTSVPSPRRSIDFLPLRSGTKVQLPPPNSIT